MKELHVGDYIFSRGLGKGNEKEDIFVTFPSGVSINLQSNYIEMIGLRKEHPDLWSVSLLTDISIKKLRFHVTDKMELITFDFSTLKEAITCQTYLSLNILKENK